MSLPLKSTPGASGSHITVDECGRIWQVMYDYGLDIYNSSGAHIGTWDMNLGGKFVYDLILLPNYVLLISSRSTKQIIQYDPQMSCS